MADCDDHSLIRAQVNAVVNAVSDATGMRREDDPPSQVSAKADSLRRGPQVEDDSEAPAISASDVGKDIAFNR